MQKMNRIGIDKICEYLLFNNLIVNFVIDKFKIEIAQNFNYN